MCVNRYDFASLIFILGLIYDLKFYPIVGSTYLAGSPNLSFDLVVPFLFSFIVCVHRFNNGFIILYYLSLKEVGFSWNVFMGGL